MRILKSLKTQFSWFAETSATSSVPFHLQNDFGLTGLRTHIPGQKETFHVTQTFEIFYYMVMGEIFATPKKNAQAKKNAQVRNFQVFRSLP